MEALLSLIGRSRWGKDFYDKEIDREFMYEGKLRLLGIVDQCDLDSCKRFRESRKMVVHEKARHFASPSPEKKTHKKKNRKEDIRMAQEEAVFGVEFVKSSAIKLQPAPLLTQNHTSRQGSGTQ